MSVEFVDAYLNLAKKELGIENQEALANVLIGLSNYIHPLTLGQVYKSKSQIQMLAEKLLVYQEISLESKKSIVKFLCSESGSHDYTIHRREASELGLVIEKPNEELYGVISNIYKDIASELEMNKPFDPALLLKNNSTTTYQHRRALIESVDYGSNVFVTEGVLSIQTIQLAPNQIQNVLRDEKSFEGWK